MSEYTAQERARKQLKELTQKLELDEEYKKGKERAYKLTDKFLLKLKNRSQALKGFVND